MDQAISCLAEKGASLLIDFNPLKSKKVILPKNSMFVITNSCVEANKAATNQFNTRVVECRLAAQVLAKSQGLEWRKVKKPLEVQKLLDVSLLEMISLVKRNIHEGVYSLDELCGVLETTKEEIVLNSLSQNTSECKYERFLKKLRKLKRF
jgi:N-acetylgalactosamine kinase